MRLHLLLRHYRDHTLQHRLGASREEHSLSEPEIVMELEDLSALFVQTAHGAEHVDGRLVLRGVTPSTLSFSDRPQRVVGHLGTAEFIGTLRRCGQTACTMFIDPFGRPRSPVRRRDERRARRRSRR